MYRIYCLNNLLRSNSCVIRYATIITTSRLFIPLVYNNNVNTTTFLHRQPITLQTVSKSCSTYSLKQLQSTTDTTKQTHYAHKVDTTTMRDTTNNNSNTVGNNTSNNKKNNMPLRIVTLLPSATEIVALLMNEAELLRTNNINKLQLVGRSHECDYPLTDNIQSAPILTKSNIHTTDNDSTEIDQQVKSQLSSVANSLYSIDSDLLQSINPDIIITQSLCSVCSIDYNEVKRISRLMNNPSLRILSLNPVSINDVLHDILYISNELNMLDEGQQAVARLQRRFDYVMFIASYNIYKQKLNNTYNQIRCAFFEWLAPIFG